MATLTADLSTEIGRANDRFEATFAHQDAAGLARLYTEDGMLLPPGSDIVEGQAAVERFWQGAMDAGIREVQLKTLELEHHGRGTIEIGAYVLRGEGRSSTAASTSPSGSRRTGNGSCTAISGTAASRSRRSWVLVA